MKHDNPVNGKAECFFCGEMVNSSIVNTGWSQRYTCDCVGSNGLSGKYQIDIHTKDVIGEDPQEKKDIGALVKQTIEKKSGAKVCDVSAKNNPSISGSILITVSLVDP